MVRGGLPIRATLAMSHFSNVGQISDLPFRKSKTCATVRYSDVQISSFPFVM